MYMCGINGFNWQDENLIKKMNTKIAHRGPDDAGVFLSSGISLGHRRLSIIDLSSAGHQPMVSRDGRYAIVYNGELYNFKEIKAELGEYKFFSNSDTEVVLCAYAKWGAGCLEKFNGIFAFAIWDKERQELFLARDQFGIKPLYYYLQNGKFIFSSETKAILEHGQIDKKLNYNSLNCYLRFLYVLGPETMWQEIKKMPPGHFAFLKNGNLELKRYYDLEIKNDLNNISEMKELIRKNVFDAVRRQLISDRPVGLFLSGGLDSSIICAAMAQEARGPIKTFSVGFETDIETEKFNADFKIAARTAEYFKTDHNPVMISAKDVAANFENCVIAMDEPVSNHIQVATYLLAKEAKKQVAVVLGGDGGDELFGGYDRYYYASFIDKARRLPLFLMNTKFIQFVGKIFHKEDLAKKFLAESEFERFWLFMAQKENIISRFLNKDYNNQSAASAAYGSYFEKQSEGAINQMMLADVKTWLVDESLVRSDKLTMAWGLEERVPLLDKNLAALAFRIPSKYKINSRHQGKKIFRDAFAGLVPDFVLEQKKRGFFSPAAKWLRGDLRQMAHEILSSGYTDKTAGLFEWNAVRRILDNHIEKKEYGLNTIWSLMTFQVWAKNYL